MVSDCLRRAANEASRIASSVITAGSAILALVTDAFGGRGGIAQYNRDFLAALALKVQRITVLPRHAPDQAVLPGKIQQLPPQPKRLGYILRALAVAMTRRVDVVFCGHLYMAPLGALIARLKGAKLVVQAHGIEFLVTAVATERSDGGSGFGLVRVAPYTSACSRLGIHRTRACHCFAKYCRRTHSRQGTPRYSGRS